MVAQLVAEPGPHRIHRSERLLATLGPFARVVLVSHVNPDPDALASMLGLQALLSAKDPGKDVILTVDGMIARAENRAMVQELEIPLVPISEVEIGPEAAVVMVDSQPHTGRRASEAATPLVVLDHHETPGRLEGVQYQDIRPHLGATSTLVTGYLLEQDQAVSRRLATALLYGIESETTGYPRESSPADDGALLWLYPRADRDLLAKIRNPKLPLSYFATFQYALSNSFLYGDVMVCFCGPVTQPDIIAELADYLIRFEPVSWAICLGVYDNLLKVSARCDHIGGHCGEVLRDAINGMGSAGGHDKRAGGAVAIEPSGPRSVESLLPKLKCRLLERLGVVEGMQGIRLLDTSPTIPAP